MLRKFRDTFAALLAIAAIVAGVIAYYAYGTLHTSPETGANIPAVNQPGAGEAEAPPYELDSPEMGLHMTLPAGWVTPHMNVDITPGADPASELEFWRDILGKIFIGGARTFALNITVKRSALSGDQWLAARGVKSLNFQDWNGMQAYFEGPSDPIYGNVNLRNYFWHQEATIKSGDVYYYFVFITSNFDDQKDARTLEDEWKATLNSAIFTKI